MTKLERPVSAEVVAEYLGVTTETVRKMARKKDNPLPHTLVGRQYRFRMSDVQEYFYPSTADITAANKSLNGADDE